MQPYHDLLREILDRGAPRDDRTGVGTLAIFGHQTRYDLSNAFGDLGPSTPDSGFPLLTTKKVHWKSIVHELLWFISGDTNAWTLRDKGVTIWDEWADRETGDLGPIYGKQWRSWPAPPESGGGAIDQLSEVVRSLRENPHSRRHIVTAWNPGELERMALPPCHCLFQFYVGPPLAEAGDERPTLSCQLYQRSADCFLGVPFNIARYALLTCLIAQGIGYRPGEFVHTLGDAHLYMNHLDKAREQLGREARPLPTIGVPQEVDVFRVRQEDIELRGYDPHPAIRAEVAV